MSIQQNIDRIPLILKAASKSARLLSLCAHAAGCGPAGLSGVHSC
jgi:hypothetical protein